jgi:hypothetical protein
VKVTRFDPDAELILVRGRVWGRRGDFEDLRLAFDTASSSTIVTPDVLDRLGYSARQGDAPATVHSAVAEESGSHIRVVRFRALGFELPDFQLFAHDLYEGCGVDGLLGLSFLRRFNYEVRSGEGRLVVDRLPD